MRWWEQVGAWNETHRFPVDAAIALVVAIAVVPTAGNLLGGADTLDVHAVSAAMVAPLAWRRVRPVASTAVVLTVALGQLMAGALLIFPADALVLVAVYSVTVYGPAWAYRTALTGALTGSFLAGVVLLLDGRSASLEAAVVWSSALALLALSAFAFGLVRRSRREAIAALVDRTQRLEVDRDQQAQIATAAERARIAREMHDIVAHSLSVIIAQADGGRYAAEQHPGAAERSLATIAETGRAALADMRRLLGVLRAPQPPSPGAGADGRHAPDAAGRGVAETARVDGPQPAVADLIPQPAVDDVAHLVAQVRDSGVRVSLVRMGTPRTLPPGTGLTVYRICQEALTNILKHAGPAPTATVLLQWATASLVLEVTDDGRGAAAGSDGGGHGVLGMRERAAMLGGTLTVGPRPGGGFRVRADIPIPALPGPTAETT